MRAPKASASSAWTYRPAPVTLSERPEAVSETALSTVSTEKAQLHLTKA